MRAGKGGRVSVGRAQAEGQSAGLVWRIWEPGSGLRRAVKAMINTLPYFQGSGSLRGWWTGARHLEGASCFVVKRGSSSEARRTVKGTPGVQGGVFRMQVAEAGRSQSWAHVEGGDS